MDDVIRKNTECFRIFVWGTGIKFTIINVYNFKENKYTGREIIFSPDGALSKLVTEISERYTIELSKNYTSVQDYDGSVVGNVIYIIAVSNDLIRENYNKLISSLAAPDTKIPPFEFYAQAYVIKGELGR